MRVVIDEDLSRSFGRELTKIGYEVKDVRDEGCRGCRDEEIYQFALDYQATLFTGDLGFGNILKFPLRVHYGIVIIHFPNEISNEEVNRQVIAQLQTLSERDFIGNLVILEPGKMRIRR